MADVKISALPNGVATTTSILPVVNGTTTQRVTVQQIVDLATANVPAGTIDTTGNTTGITVGAALPIDQVLREVIDKAAFNQYGANHSILTVQSPDWAPGAWGGDGTIQAGGVAAGEMLTGTLYYGALIDLNSRAVLNEGYILPLPTQQGYLRADQDPATGWYFAEPVILSNDPPPAPPGDPQLPTIWAKPVDAANVTANKGLTLEQVRAEIDAKLAGLTASVSPDPAANQSALMDDMRRALNGGVLPPLDITTWTKCPIGPAFPGPQTSTVEVTQVNGVLYFRGEMHFSLPTQNSLAGFAYLELPAGFAAPPADTRAVVTGRANSTATSLSVGTITITTSRLIRFQIGNCDQVYLTGAIARII